MATYCSHCGSFNEGRTHACLSCLRPLADGRSVSDQARCPIHPDQSPYGECVGCGVATCFSCGSMVDQRIHCLECAARTAVVGQDGAPMPARYGNDRYPSTGDDPDAKTWGMIAHLSTYTGFVVPFGNLLGPLVVKCSKGRDGFVNRNANAVLNFELSLLIYGFAIVPLLLLLVFGMGLGSVAAIGLAGGLSAMAALGLPIVVIGVALFLLVGLCVLGVLGLVLPIVAAVHSRRGDVYRYPLTLHLLKEAS